MYPPHQFGSELRLHRQRKAVERELFPQRGSERRRLQPGRLRDAIEHDDQRECEQVRRISADPLTGTGLHCSSLPQSTDTCELGLEKPAPIAITAAEIQRDGAGLI